MNLVLRGAEGDIRIGDSYHDDKFPELRADYVVSNPPFNDSGWGAERVKPEIQDLNTEFPLTTTEIMHGFSIIFIILRLVVKLVL